MLRSRLLFGLLTLVLLLAAVGFAGLLLLHDAGKRYQDHLISDYEVIDRAQNLRSYTSLLNNTYLTYLAGPPSDNPPESILRQQVEKKLRVDLERLAKRSAERPRWDATVRQLSITTDLYLEGLQTIIESDETPIRDRTAFLRQVAGLSQRINDLADSLAALAEENLFSSAQALDDEANHNTLFIATLVALGIAIAVIIYFRLARQLVDPVVALRNSIDEVRKGNFELCLPDQSTDGEFKALVASFNEMASELHLRRRDTDERLIKKNLINQALLAAIPSPVYVLTNDGEVLQINSAAENLNDRLRLQARLPQKINRLLKDCRQTDTSLLPEDPREALLFRIDNDERYYLPRIFRFSSGSGQQTIDGSPHSGWAILLHDVTRIRWLDDMKTNMLSTVSHEIRTPLTGIRMVLHLLMEEDRERFTEIQQTMLSSAQEDCERLLITLNTLLDLSRVESGTTHLQRKALDLGTIVAKNARLMEATAHSTGVKLRIDHSASAIPLVLGDEIRLSEVVNNLISNALKHSPKDSEVVLRLEKNDAKYVRLSVIDRGLGVPEEDQQKIFERFFRSPGQTSEGVGLGLFISREIIRAHEGRIGLIERDDRQQTEFFIDVPLA